MQDTLQIEKTELKDGNASSSDSGKIKLGEYPYTYVRTAVMRTLLIKPEQYDRLLKMSIAEIARYLEETEYKKEIDQLALNYSGIDLLEQALNKNLVKTFEKLRRISADNLLKIIDIYLMRKDIHNLKTILRGKFINSSSNEIQQLLIPAGMLTAEDFISLLRHESVDDIFRSKKVSSLITLAYLKQHLENFRQTKDIAKLETALDKFYFDALFRFSMRLPAAKTLFDEFVSAELAVLNIMTILRLKREGILKTDIQKYLILNPNMREQRKLDYLLKASDVDEIVERLNKLGYSSMIKDGFNEYKKTGSFAALEMDFKRYLLRKTLLFGHKNPLSVDTILSFMFAKDMEIRNLMLLVKCKQFGFDEDFIRKQLVV